MRPPSQRRRTSAQEPMAEAEASSNLHCQERQIQTDKTVTHGRLCRQVSRDRRYMTV